MDSTPWIQSITTDTADGVIHCGIKCMNFKKAGKPCLVFRFENGVCELSDLCVQSTTLTSPIKVFRVKKGKSIDYLVQKRENDFRYY